MRMRTISARSPNSGRGSARRSTRRASPPACWRRAASASPARRKFPIEIVAQGARVDDRPVRRRIHRRRPFDSRKLRARDPHARRARRPYRRLEDRRDAAASAGRPTRRVCRALGDEGVLALDLRFDQCAARGRKPVRGRCRRDARRARRAGAKGRVVVTTFASNVARLRAAAEAGLADGTQVMVIGRAMERVIAVARECGYLDGLPPFLGQDHFDRIPRDKVLALATGSQGEPRAALARIAEDEHPTATLAPGDMVDLLLAHHSRQRKGGRQDHQRPGRAGHRGRHRPHAARPRLRPSAPRRTCADVRLAAAEDRHSRAWRGAASVRTCGLRAARRASREVVRAFNGDIVRWRRRGAAIVGQVDHGRRYKDGEILLPAERRMRRPAAPAVLRRRRLDRPRADARKGEMAGDPDVMIAGLPSATREGAGMDEIIDARDLRDVRKPAARQAARRRRPCRPRSSAPCATRSTPSGARNRRCMCWWSRSRGGRAAIENLGRPCDAEPKQSSPAAADEMDCLAALAMTAKRSPFEASLSFRNDRDSLGRLG